MMKWVESVGQEKKMKGKRMEGGAVMRCGASGGHNGISLGRC